MTLALLLVAFVASSPASAAEWWIVLQNDAPGNVHFADTAQLRKSGNYVTLWTHIFYRQPIDGIKSARIQREVNCSTYSLRERRYLDFDAERQVIGSGDNTDSEGWSEVAPDTSGSRYVEFACGTPEQREREFLRVEKDVDLFEVADFFLDSRPIVRLPAAKH